MKSFVESNMCQSLASIRLHALPGPAGAFCAIDENPVLVERDGGAGGVHRRPAAKTVI